LAKAAHQNGKEKQDNSCNIRQMISVPHFQVYVPVSVLSEDCLVYFSLADVTDGGRKTFAATHADTHRVQQREPRKKRTGRRSISSVLFFSIFSHLLVLNFSTFLPRRGLYRRVHRSAGGGPMTQIGRSRIDLGRDFNKSDDLFTETVTYSN
jgi:hypothetical protein